MSCLLQLPSISFHYSQLASPSAGLVMDMPNSTPHESRESPRNEQFSNQSANQQLSNMPVNTESTSFHHHPEVYLSCDTSGHIKDDGGFDPLKNEPYFPQQNSPVEYSRGEHSEHNGFIQNPRPRFNVMEENATPYAIQGQHPQPCHIAARTNDAFSLNLKLELENYVHACETGIGEQFRKFRAPISPASSLSCSTSSLLSLAPTTGAGAGCPSRRHSFSAALQSAESAVPGHFPSIHNPLAGSTNSNSAYYRQRSHTYSSSSSKPFPYPPLTKRQAGWQTSQNDLHDRIGDLQIRHDNDDSNHLGMDEDVDFNDRSGEPSRDVSRKGSIDDSKSTDPLNFLFLGPFGKKRKMVHERKQSLEGTERDLLHHTPMDDQSLDTSVLSPVGSDLSTHKEKVEDIVEEDEFDESAGIEVSYEESNEPLNLCLGEECETVERVSRLNLNCAYSSQPSLNTGMKSGTVSGSLLSPPDGSVLRRQLLGLTETIGPTPPQYQTRDRSASMSVITLRNRLSVIQETRAALNPRRTLSPPPTNRTNGFMGPSNAISTLSINSSTSETSTSTKRILECQDCGKVFSQLRNYRYHRSRHEGTSQFACTCPVCHKQFNDRGYLSSHLKIHKNAKEYSCEFCEKSFNQRVAYNMHVRIHTGVKPHQCLKCDKAFSRRMLLKQHERTHTGERPYKCEICSKAFADRSNMLLHQRLHTGLRPFHCDICGKSFSKNHHLKTHLNHHAGIKPYQCPKCHATFSQSSNMKTHFRKCTAVPVDENTGFTDPQDQKNAAKTVVVGKCPTVVVPPNHPPPNSYNYHFEDRSKQLSQSDTYRLSSESGDRNRSNTFSHERRGSNVGFAPYHLSPHLRSVSPEGTHGSSFQLSSSAPLTTSIHGYMQNHPHMPPMEMYSGDTVKVQGVSPHSHSFNPDNEGGRNSFLQFALVETGRNGTPSHHIPIKVSPVQAQRFSPQELRPPSQIEHSPQHHIQQSLQHLQLSPHTRLQSGLTLTHQEEFRGRASTWSTNPAGRPTGFGKRKLPL